MIQLENLTSENFDLILLAVKPKDALKTEKDIFNSAPAAIFITVVAGIALNK